MKQPNISVTKATGEKAPFSEDRLRHSLKRSGASAEQIDMVVDEISAELYEGISTKEIYRTAFKVLKSKARHTAARYHLKQGIMELGPSGFPFEKYISELLNHQGYSTKTGQFLKGRCLTHEIDVVAEKEAHRFLVECKYHNGRGIFCDVKVPLYIHSRFNDVMAGMEKSGPVSTKSQQAWIVTNTRFSVDAIQYGNCAGLKLMGWDYPSNGSLKDLVDRLGLYPVTCLTTLTRLEKQRLLDKRIVLCREILEHENLLSQLGIKPPRIKSILTETRQLCQNTRSVNER
jgi:hypothetical protein